MKLRHSPPADWTTLFTPYVRLCFLAFLLSTPASSLFGVELDTVLNVDVPRENWVHQANFHILRWDVKNRGYKQIPSVLGSHSESRLSATVQRGRYLVEVLQITHEGSGLRALRTTALHVKDATQSITLPKSVHRDLTVSLNGKTLPIRSLFVRSAAETGDVRLTPKTPCEFMPLELSAGMTYRFIVHAADGKDHALLNLELSSDDSWSLVADDKNQIRFPIRSDTPPISDATAWCAFPGKWVQIDNAETATLVTNYKRVLMNYLLRLQNGRRAKFERRPYILKKKTDISIGGPIVAQGWAFALYEELGSGWKPHLRWGLSLLDTGGHQVDLAQSSLNHNFSASIDGTRPVATKDDNKSMDVEAELFAGKNKLLSAVKLWATWEWEAKHSGPIPTEGLTTVRSQHFELEVPKPWRWQTQNYLNMLERSYSICRNLTKRNGPKTVNVDWRHSPGGAAKASIGRVEGGQRDIWMSLPFTGFRECWSQFAEPSNGSGDPYMIHETLHLFGYNHGPEMTSIEHRGEWLFKQVDWHLRDHPEQFLEYVSVD